MRGEGAKCHRPRCGEAGAAAEIDYHLARFGLQSPAGCRAKPENGAVGHRGELGVRIAHLPRLVRRRTGRGVSATGAGRGAAARVACRLRNAAIASAHHLLDLTGFHSRLHQLVVRTANLCSRRLRPPVGRRLQDRFGFTAGRCAAGCLADLLQLGQRTFAIDRAFAIGEEGLPRHALRVGDPLLSDLA